MYGERCFEQMIVVVTKQRINYETLMKWDTDQKVGAIVNKNKENERDEYGDEDV